MILLKLTISFLVLAVGAFISAIFIFPHDEPPYWLFCAIGVSIALGTIFGIIFILTDKD